MRRLAIALTLLLFASTVASVAEEKTEPKEPELKVTQLILIPKKADSPSDKKKEEKRQARRTASLGDVIVLKAEPDLGKYLDDAAKQNKAVTLFLDGKDTGILPEAIDLDAGTLRFHLERSGDNERIWAGLLRDPLHYPTRTVKASIGLSGDVAVKAEKSTFTLVVVKWEWYAFLWVALLIGVMAVFTWLVLKRDLLRDGPKPCPYSLGRCQMAWWFFLILIGYVMIWLISGDQDTIPPSLLALMGISAGTALGAVLIESASIAVKPTTRGLFRDILSDNNGTVGLHRFQIVVWTIVLGIIFTVSVVTELSMPVFSNTLLATMGISAGTYLGFKFPEK